MRMPRLLILTDRRQLPPGRRLLDTLDRCAQTGTTTVVVRELDLSESARANIAVDLAPLVPVISAHTALPGTGGVHLAAHQPVGDAAGLAHGRSCHTVEEVARAVEEGASWVTVSPVAQSLSKPGHGPPLGPAELRAAVAAAENAPVFGLGGADLAGVADLQAAGLHGVAVMGAVMRATDPAVVVSRLLAEWEDQ